MARSLRGLNEGLQTGLQLGAALRGVRRDQALADEAARYNVTEGAYGEDLNQNIEQVRGLMTEAQRQAAAQGGTVEDMARIEAQYMPSIQELQRRSQMTAPDFTVASRSMRPEDTFTTREAATRAARPMRAEGLANVYERFGDIEQAEAARERADAGRLRDIQFQQAQIGLRGAQRTEREAEGMQMAQQLLAGAEQAGQPITAEFLRVVASQTGANYNAVVDSAAKAIGFTEASATASLNQLKRDLSKAATTGVSGLNKFLADKFDPDETDNFKPEVTRDARGNFVVTYGGQVLPQYGASRSLEELVARTQGNIDGDPLGTVKTLLDIDVRRAQLKEANQGLSRGNLIQVEDAQGNLKLLDTDRLQRDANGQPIVPAGFRKAGARSEAKPLTARQQLAFDTVKGTDRYKRAAEMGDIPTMREMLTANNIPPEAVLGDIALPPGQGASTANPWAPPAPAAQPARPAAAAQPAAATPAAQPGLARQPAQPASATWLAGRREQLAAADTALAQAQAQASAAVRSGDANAIRYYGDILNRVRAERNAIFADVARYQ